MKLLMRRLVCALQVIALCIFSLAAVFNAPVTSAFASPPEGFAAPQIRDIWQRDDGAIASGRVKGAWMWGPGPFYTDYEPYTDAPQGNHLVQYFDKGRLEINDPSADPASRWFVTSGLLVREMVSGEAQTGAGTYYNIGPANVAIAGDGDNIATPTYSTFAGLQGAVASRQSQQVAQLLDRAGKVTTAATSPQAVTLARFEPTTGHNWAGVFWDFVNAQAKSSNFQWLYTLGYPITEPYWVDTTVSGHATRVLVQLFERRTLTYSPDNPAASQVEMGNVGRHYYNWRYSDRHETALGTRYGVTITVGPAPSRLTNIVEVVDLLNSTGGPLKRVVLSIPWHHWDGVVTLRSATTGGVDAATRWVQGINLEVTLPRSAPVGAHVTFVLNLDLKPRPVGGRTGYDMANDILSLGDAVPAVVTWENGGWAYYPYSDLGDLGHYVTSDYTVEIKPLGSERLVVGGTGVITTSQPQSGSWKFNAPGVRDVAYVVSPRFTNPLNDAGMTRKVGNTTILAYFLPEHRAAGLQQLALVAPAFAWYGKQIGAYPFDVYTVAEMGVPLEPTDNYAQEYPMDYFIPTSWLKLGTSVGTWTWFTPFHEVGHQWFYSTVGNNQLTDPWLDEAMTTYICAEYVRVNFPDQYARSWTSMSNGASAARPISSGVFSGFTSENQYTATVYDTAVVMLNKVRLAMGDTSFYSALRDYYSTFRQKRATPHDLLAILQRHSSVDLGAIFAQYVAN